MMSPAGPRTGPRTGPGGRWLWLGLLLLAGPNRALEPGELFPFGEAAGDRRLQPGTDSTGELRLDWTVSLFRGNFHTVYINTNGFLSVEVPPEETSYLGQSPAPFRMAAALLGDLAWDGGGGGVFFREERRAAVLRRVARHVKDAFPEEDGDAPPAAAVVVTWSNVTAADDLLGEQRNTFQMVVVSMESSTFAILLFPAGGLQFLSSAIGGRRLPLETGFSEGRLDGWFWSRQGGYYRAAGHDTHSVWLMGRGTNCGRRGVWVYEIGAWPYFFGVTPGSVSEEPGAAREPVTTLPWQPDATTSETAATTPTAGAPVGAGTASAAEPRYAEPDRRPRVEVDEDRDLDGEVFSYGPRSCSGGAQACSAFAECRRHAHGHCCHCRDGYYGNGRDCLPVGKPQRMSGKVSGRVSAGSSPLAFSDKELHAYVVANEGRVYVALSGLPPSLGPSLLPLASPGGAVGWAFALERPGHRNGFALVGGGFSLQAEVTFRPGNERLTLSQRFRGADEHGNLAVTTELSGAVPSVPLGSGVHVDPYQELYQYGRHAITSSSSRSYTVSSPGGAAQTFTSEWQQTVTFHSCPYDDAAPPPSSQLLTVDQIFVMFDADNNLVRFATSNKIGPAHVFSVDEYPLEGVSSSCEQEVLAGSSSEKVPVEVKGGVPEQNPCYSGHHGCAADAVCEPREGVIFSCRCSEGFSGDGRICSDVDECLRTPCHADASCSNTPGSFSCGCRPGFRGDGFRCSPASSECERQREEAGARSSSGFLSFLLPSTDRFLPRCGADGSFLPQQCHGGACWCVDAGGAELPGSRTDAAAAASLCIDRNAPPPPPTVGPAPRPDVDPMAPGSGLIFAQSGGLQKVPLHGDTMDKDQASTLLHLPDRVVIAVAFDCVEMMVYWSDISGPSISRARLSGGDVMPVITEGLASPEGLAVDPASRLLFWTDSGRDTLEVSRLDGSHRRVLIDSRLVNPRPVVTNPPYGQLFWADWDRDGPKIEMSNMDGSERSVLVQEDLGLPNALTFDLQGQQLYWADAGTRRLESVDPQGRRRRLLEGLHYPFAVAFGGRSLFYTDWRREAVVAVDRLSESEADEFLPQKRSRLYGIAMVTAQCPQAYNSCANNGGCSHLCLPRPGGFTCRCSDAAEGRCVERNP